LAKKSLLSKLKERRVIRATLIYVALLWVALQAADLLAGAEMLSDRQVRWIILLGAAGLPITILASWFLETPWKQRKWIAVAGDVLIIGAITVAVALFAWQQWFTSFTRPTVAVLKIEATDMRAESDDLAAHLVLRLRTALATRPELRVIELRSSQHAQLDGRSIAEKAVALNADYLLAGTIAQSDSRVRLNLQLYSANGDLLHGESFEDRLLDQAQLQNRVITDLWQHLPLPDDGLIATRRFIADCKYPDDRNALLAIAAIDNNRTVSLNAFVASFDDAGMLKLGNARRLLLELTHAEPTRKPVLLPLAMQSVAAVEMLCPGLPDASLLRVTSSQEFVSDGMLRRHPSSAALYLRASRQNSEPNRANAFLNEALLLDPLGDW
jgi:TolB-like protein